VGDHNPSVTAHAAIPKALDINGRACGCDVATTWLPTESLEGGPEPRLRGFDGLWCVPASPYNSMQGALWAIQFARESKLPFLGTCGGFQHAVLEFARNVLGHAEAAHAEVDPGAAMPLIAPLSCALVETEGEIHFAQQTRIAAIYGAEPATETYHCSFGLDFRFASLFGGSAMVISAVDAAGEPRAVELNGHPFFVGTAFQPERSALRGLAHPLISAFVAAANPG
jgi:CTP synthase (UTP-ammonia lyase)